MSFTRCRNNDVVIFAKDEFPDIQVGSGRDYVDGLSIRRIELSVENASGFPVRTYVGLRNTLAFRKGSDIAKQTAIPFGKFLSVFVLES